MSLCRAVPARALVPLAVALAALAGSCTEIGTNPTVVTALEFDTLPYPAVVTGDTLRDSLGRAAPLRAIAFSATGAIVPNAAIRYYALDSGLTIDPSGIVTAQLRNGSVRVIASVPNLQSVVQHLSVSRRPDTVIVTSPTNDTLAYVLPDNAGANVSPALSLRVVTRDTAGGITGTQGWLISYQVVFHGTSLATTDTTVASLWDGGGHATLIDTTGVDGAASRRLRVRPAGLPTAVESLTVIATVRYHGASVRGSPVSFVIHTRPK